MCLWFMATEGSPYEFLFSFCRCNYFMESRIVFENSCITVLWLWKIIHYSELESEVINITVEQEYMHMYIRTRWLKGFTRNFQVEFGIT